MRCVTEGLVKVSEYPKRVNFMPFPESTAHVSTVMRLADEAKGGVRGAIYGVC